MTILLQTAWLFLLALPIACIAWTVTHEEIFKEPRDFCINKSKTSKSMLLRKFFYLFTCEYCFSHYITLAFLIISGYHLLFADWRGYLIGGFALVWIANVYMSLFGFIRVGMKRKRQMQKLMNANLRSSKREKMIQQPDNRNKNTIHYLFRFVTLILIQTSLLYKICLINI